MAIRGQNFATCYAEMCKQQRVKQLPTICVTLPHSLDFTTERIKLHDWGPILNSLSLDRSLKSVSVRSKWYLQGRRPLEELNIQRKRTLTKASPVVLTRYLLEWLSQSISQCVRNSPTLTNLELEGVPLPTDCLAALCVGLAGTQTLQHLSLKRCHIGDNNCTLICSTIAEVQSIKSLNLSQCDLSANCGIALASTLCRQKLLLYHDAWKDSLRYRVPNPEAMSGLRRLTLNDNPQLGDSAIAQVIDAIQDSLWLKALDLQNCGLTDAIGKNIIELLDNNKTLQVLDVRSNMNLNDNIVQIAYDRIGNNNEDGGEKYKLLKLTQSNSKVLKASKRVANDVDKNKILRSKSMIVTNVKRPYHVNGVPATRPSTRPSCPTLTDGKSRKRKVITSSYSVQKVNNKVTVKEPTKASLHLDIQAQIQSVDDSWNENEQVQEYQLNNNDKMSTEMSIESQESIQEVEEIKITYKFEDLLKQLLYVKMEKNNLLKNTQKIQVELEEERTRRQTIETKLWMIKKYFTADLENVLKARGLGTRQYLHASQQSLHEMALSLAKILEILKDYANNYYITEMSPEISEIYEAETASISASESKNEVTKRDEEVEEIKEEKKKRKTIDSVRTTKSENVYSGYFQVKKSSKKLSKSENDIRQHKYKSVNVPFNIQKIGDRPDSVTSSLKSTYRRKNLKQSSSARDRARAIFAQIIKSNTKLNLGSGDH